MINFGYFTRTTGLLFTIKSFSSRQWRIRWSTIAVSLSCKRVSSLAGLTIDLDEMPNPRDPVDLPPETLMSGWASMVVMDCMTKFTPDPAAPGNNMSQYGEWVLGLDARLDALALAAKFTKKPDASKSSIHKEVRGWAITDDPTRQSLPFWTRNESGKMYSTLATIRVNERTGGISEVASLLERYYRACYRLLQVPDLFDPQRE